MRTVVLRCLMAAAAVLCVASPFASVRAESAATPAGAKYLYATASGRACASNSVQLFNAKTYKPVGTITSGIDCPNGITLDAKGNLYVANLGPPDEINQVDIGNIAVFAPGNTTPTTILTGGGALVSAEGLTTVTVDRRGNVYAGAGPTIRSQQTPTGVVMWPAGNTSEPYFIGGGGDVGNTGEFSIAVDSKGNVFDADGNIVRERFKSKSFPWTPLQITTTRTIALAVDKQDNLLIGDLTTGMIDVWAPPYQSVTRTVGSGLVEPTDIKLNADNTLLYVSDTAAGKMIVFNYQTGEVVTSVSIPQVWSAVKPPNSVNK